MLNAAPTRNKRAQWWRDQAQRWGPTMIDSTLSSSSDWQELLASGRADIGRMLQRNTIRRGRDLDVLEIGCGMGRCAFGLAEHYGTVVGTDINPFFIEAARAHNTSERIQFHLIVDGSLKILPSASFDVVFCIEVFHHVDEDVLHHYLAEAQRLLRDGGQLVVQVNVSPLRIKTRLARAASGLLHRLGKNCWRGLPTAPAFHRVYHQPARLMEILRCCGFEIEEADYAQPRQAWFIGRRAQTR